jgi:hypothetical protein
MFAPKENPTRNNGAAGKRAQIVSTAKSTSPVLAAS